MTLHKVNIKLNFEECYQKIRKYIDSDLVSIKIVDMNNKTLINHYNPFNYVFPTDEDEKIRESFLYVAYLQNMLNNLKENEKLYIQLGNDSKLSIYITNKGNNFYNIYEIGHII
jgi:hypothetical protein